MKNRIILLPALTLASTLLPTSVLAAGGGLCQQVSYDALAIEAPPDNQVLLLAEQALMQEAGLSNLAGSVKLVQGDKQFSADALDYDSENKRVRVKAESLFRNKEFIIRSREASFDLNSEEGVFSGTDFTLPSRGARGSASRVTLNSEGQAEIRDASYTSCAPDSQAWYLRASDIRMDREEGLGTATNARLVFGGVPIFYTPWLQFPIDNRRRTGLLYPTIGESSPTGLDIRVPVYLNLHPSVDATLTPRIMSRRGVQLNTGVRYLLNQGEGTLEYEYLNKDNLTDEQRTYFSADNKGLISSRLSYAVQYGDASDRQYFEDLGGQGNYATRTHLERSAQFEYDEPAAYTIKAQVQDYQTVASNVAPIDEPYARLPQIVVNARTKNSLLGLRPGIDAEFVNFARDDSIEGQRTDLAPYLRMDRQEAAWFASARADYRYTQYQLTGVGAGQPTTPERAIPQFSADAGLRFERALQDGRLQTLEPRVFYLYTPFRNQDVLPVFDSGEPDFEFTQLFSRNRFSGVDRLADANQIAIAATSRLLDPETGVVRFSASVGQLFRMTAPRVSLPGTPPPDSGATDFIASLDYRLSDRWSYITTAQWSPSQEKFNRSSLGVRYRENDRRADLSYRYRQNILEQLDFAASLPVIQQWRLATRLRYSLRDSSPLDSLLGVEYDTCCYALRASYRRFIATTAGEYNTGIYIQLELKGLTRIGTGFDKLLPVDEGLTDGPAE